MELPFKYLFVVLSWMLWCALHSTLITETVTAYMEKRLADQYRFYRLFYNIFSLVTVIPLVYYSRSLRGRRSFVGKASWQS